MILSGTCGCTGGPMRLRTHVPRERCLVKAPWAAFKPETDQERRTANCRCVRERQSEHLDARAERLQPAPPPLPPQDGTERLSAIQIYSVGGERLCEPGFDSGAALGGPELVRKLKARVQESTGIPRWEQRLLVDASWRHATLVRIQVPHVLVKLTERVEAGCQLNGTPNSKVTYTGNFAVASHHAAKADLASFKLACSQGPQFKYKLHPNLVKLAWNDENRLVLREGKSLNQYFGTLGDALTLMKWQTKNSNTSFLPVTLVCTFHSSALHAKTVVEVELKDASLAVEGVCISFTRGVTPASIREVGETSSHVSVEASHGSQRQLRWQIPQLDASADKHNLELCAPVGAAPIKPVSFTALVRSRVMCPIDIQGCYNRDTKEQLTCGCEKEQTYNVSLG